ncbi:hypothetical protein ACNKHK_02955 [Shigella flexneri]
MALVVATLLLNWIMICLAHPRFRAAMRRRDVTRSLKRCCIHRELPVYCFPGMILC